MYYWFSYYYCINSSINIVATNIKSEGLVDKSAICGFINNADLDKKKVATLATKAELKAEQDKITNIQALDSSYFRGKSHFEDNSIKTI